MCCHRVKRGFGCFVPGRSIVFVTSPSRTTMAANATGEDDCLVPLMQFGSRAIASKIWRLRIEVAHAPSRAVFGALAEDSSRTRAALRSAAAPRKSKFPARAQETARE